MPFKSWNKLTGSTDAFGQKGERLIVRHNLGQTVLSYRGHLLPWLKHDSLGLPRKSLPPNRSPCPRKKRGTDLLRPPVEAPFLTRPRYDP